MKVYKLPKDLKAIVFDIDSTLYTNEAYAESQIEGQIRRLAQERGNDYESMRAEIDAFRADYAKRNSGAKTSLGNAFLHFGVTIETSARWREELIDPFAYLKPDPKLDAALSKLGEAYALACVTNNPSLVGRRTLEALGVSAHIPIIVGLESCMVSKPAREPFQRVLAELRQVVPVLEAEQALAIGDRYDVDLAIPLELGMGGILVNGVEDLYTLPELLLAKGVY